MGIKRNVCINSIIHNTIDESVLTVEYKFSYTSNGGLAQRSFTVPMTEEPSRNLLRCLKTNLLQVPLHKNNEP